MNVFKGLCVGATFGLKACLHGIKPHPKTSHLSLVYSPMEYRVRLMPVSKEWRKSHVTVKVVHDKSTNREKGQMSKLTMTVGNKAGGTERKLDITGTFDGVKTSLTVTPPNVPGLEFKKFCITLTSRDKGLLVSASFDKRCLYKNLKV